MPISDPPLVYTVKEYPVPHAKKVVFFFCPFGIRSGLLSLPGMPIWRLRQHGYSVVAYSYTTVIATVSLQITLANIEAIIADANTRIALVPSDTEVICFGTSMGTVMAATIAAQHRRIKKVILNLSYANISDHIVALPSIRTISSKQLKAYVQSAGTEENLRRAFEPYSPLTLVDEFRDKKLLVYSSRDDRILQFVHTSKFHLALQQAGIDLTYYQNGRGGHYFAALINYLRYRRWLRFLQET